MLRNQSRRRRGNAIIEFALASSILFPTFAGVFQFGYTFYTYNTLQGSVRAAARFASVRQYTATTSTPASEYSSEIKNMVVYGKPNPVLTAAPGVTVDIPVTNGLTADNVSLDIVMNGSIPKTITVKVTNFTIDAIFSKFTFNGKPAATFWYNGPTS